MPKREEEPFVVSDKRKFTAEGELRPDVQSSDAEDMTEPQAEPAPTAADLPASSPSTLPESTRQPGQAGDEKMPPPPTAAEQKAQHDEYHSAGRKLDSMLDSAGAQRPADMEMTFERLSASLYMQAMMQLGMLREEDVAPQPDLISARQTIDTIALLQEKTKGNLSERETHMLQNCLFELRMAFLEIANILTRPTDPNVKPGAPGAPIGGINK